MTFLNKSHQQLGDHVVQLLNYVVILKQLMFLINNNIYTAGEITLTSNPIFQSL